MNHIVEENYRLNIYLNWGGRKRKRIDIFITNKQISQDEFEKVLDEILTKFVNNDYPLLSLKCNKCTFLTNLELPALQSFVEFYQLHCTGCIMLTSLTNLPMLNWLDCDGCTALTAISNLPILESLECRKCTALSTLTNVPKLLYLCCDRCTSLSTLPNLPMLENLGCGNCTALTSLSDFPKLDMLKCIGCTALSTLTDLPMLEWLDCTECTALKTLPNLPTLRTLFCRRSGLYIVPSDISGEKFPRLTHCTCVRTTKGYTKDLLLNVMAKAPYVRSTRPLLENEKPLTVRQDTEHLGHLPRDLQKRIASYLVRKKRFGRRSRKRRSRRRRSKCRSRN